MNSKAFRAEITITGVYIFETPSYHVSVRFLSGIYCFEWPQALDSLKTPRVALERCSNGLNGH